MEPRDPRPPTTPARMPAGLSDRDGWAEYFERARPPEPHVHQIEPTNHCPYACKMCPRPTRMERPLGFMDFGLYRRVVDEIASFQGPSREREVELFHFGESLLHPQLPEMVAYGARSGLNLVLSVNAPSLGPALARQILEAAPRKLIVSLDGTDAESYRELRGPRAELARAEENLKALARLREQTASDARVVVRMIALHRNRGQADAFLRRWEGEGLEAEIREFFPWGEPEMAALGDYRRFPTHMPCPYPWQYVVVQWNGDVVACCRDYNARLVMGNVRETSLVEIWGGEAYRNLREQHRSGRFGENGTCRVCTALYSSGDPDPERETPLCARESAYWVRHLGSVEEAARRLGRAEETVAQELEAHPGALSPAPPRDRPVRRDDLSALWREAARDHGPREYLVDDEEGSRYRFSEASAIADAVAHRLRAAGVVPGERVLIWSALHPEALLLLWASALVGATVVPLAPDLSPERASDAAGRAAPALVFTDGVRAGRLRGSRATVVADGEGAGGPEVPPFSEWLREEDRRPFEAARADPEAPGAILFTSGTDGEPKAVVLARHALVHSGRLLARAYGWGPGDVLLATGDLHAMSGLRNPTTAAACAGVAVVLASARVRGSGPALADCVERHGVTLLATVPATLRLLLAEADRSRFARLGRLRSVLVTGTRLPPGVREAFQDRFGVPVFNYYGLTETAGFCAGDLPGGAPPRPDSIGREVDALFRIAGPGGQEVPAGETGELWVQSSNLFSGYLGDAGATGARLSGRWFHTGDLVRREPDGTVTLLGRTAEVIKTAAGEILSAAEVEGALLSEPDVADACAVPGRGPSGEERLVAYVAPALPLTAGEGDTWARALTRRLLAKLGPRRMPSEIRVRATLPRGASGKVAADQFDRLEGGP